MFVHFMMFERLRSMKITITVTATKAFNITVREEMPF